MAPPAPCGFAWSGESGEVVNSTRCQSQLAHSERPDAIITEHDMSYGTVPSVGCIIDGGCKSESRILIHK